MKNRVGLSNFIIVAAFVGALAVALVVNRSPESGEAVVEAASMGGGVSGGSAAGEKAGAVPVEEAYQKLTERMQALQQDAQRARSAETREDILGEMDLLLSEFIDSYPGTAEAHDAAFEAGLVNFTLQKPPKAIRFLETFLQNAVNAPRDKQAYAHFYLAEAYKQDGKYERAEAEYKIVIDQFGDIDRRLSSAVQQSLVMLESERKLKIGGNPIPFEVTSLKGQKLSLDKYKGKVVLLDFWATWCAPCRQEMPNVIKIYDKYNNDGFEIVGISLDRNREDLDRYIDKYEISWPQYFDGKFWQNDVAAKYGIQAIPATFLIDKKGKIRFKSLRGGQLESAIKKLLAE